MINKFLEWLEKQVGGIYVWGAQGEISYNEEWIKKKETSETNANRAINLYRKKTGVTGEKVPAYDCSGLIVKFLLDNKLIDSDMTAQGLFSVSDKTDRSSLRAGDFVFRDNGTKIHHVGVYVGGDMVIHAKGRDVGVVKEHIDANGDNYWNAFARFPKFAVQKCLRLPCFMYYSGATYVNLRSTPSATTSKTIIGKVACGEEVLVLELMSSGWADVVKYDEEKDKYTRGFCVSTYLKEV